MDNDDSENLKARIQELEDELQKIKEQKRKEYTDSAAVDEEIEEVHDQIRDEVENSGMSRRKFMKAIAGGGAALGAAAMMPSAAALDIESSTPISYNDNFSVDTPDNLNLNDKDISNAGSVGATSVNTGNLEVDGYSLLATTTGDVVVEDGTRFNPADYSDDLGSAFNDAHAYLSNNSLSTIYLPDGHHTYSEQFVIDWSVNPIEVVGAGKNSTVLNYEGAEGDGILLDGASEFSLHDFGMEESADGIRAELSNNAVRNGQFKDLLFRNIGGHGIVSGPGGASNDYFNIYHSDILYRRRE